MPRIRPAATTRPSLLRRLTHDQPGERQHEREARRELHALLHEAASEIRRLRKLLRLALPCVEAALGHEGDVYGKARNNAEDACNSIRAVLDRAAQEPTNPSQES